jgi:hypothetical protein
MTDEEKLKVFGKHLDMMHSKVIRDFTCFCVLRFPEYFWALPASTSGRNHGSGETLIDHIQGCLWLAERVIDQFDKAWTQRQKDQLLAAIILHDGWRCEDAQGCETVFTQEYLSEKGMPSEMLGKPRTSHEHPEAGFRQLLKLSVEFNGIAAADKTQPINGKDLSAILNAVRMHYGPWLEIGEKPFSLDWPFSNLAVQVHNIDHMQTVNATYWTRAKGVSDASDGEVQETESRG